MARFSFVRAISAAALIAAPSGVAPIARAASPDLFPPDEPDEIIVTTTRKRGGALSDFEPELVLEEEDIAAYGAGSFGELLDAISPSLSSGRGRSNEEPVVLLNGRRVSGFRELDNYPVEALSRVEVLPEEASLAYGFPADQRVLNFVLKPNVTMATLTGRAARPFEGAQTPLEGVGQLLQVNDDERRSIDAEVKKSDRILESDRDIVFSGPLDERAFRTVSPESLNWRAGFSAGKEVFRGAVATVNGSYVSAAVEDWIGKSPFDNAPRRQARDTNDIYAGLTLVSELAPSTWTFGASYSRIDVGTKTDLSSAPGDQRETSFLTRAAAVNFVLNQRLADLPAGPLSLTASTEWIGERQRSRIDAPATQIRADGARDRFSGALSIDVPVFAPGPLPGKASINGNIDVDRLSDLGWLTTYGYGLTYKPSDSLRLIASATVEEGAPSLSDLSAPLLVTPNARVFDFKTGTDLFADVITGGNPTLLADRRRVYKVGVQWTAHRAPDFQVNIDYTTQKLDNEVRVFPLLTEAFESAFPGRVQRDGAGRLLAFDRRPIQADRSYKDEVRTMLTFTQPIKAKRVQSSGPPPTKRRRSGRPGSTRISLTHQWRLRDEVVIAPGAPVFDFLDGAASGALGGTPGHVVEASLYRWNNGLGFIAAARYQRGTKVKDPSGDLAFSDLFFSIVRVTYEFNYNDAALRALPFLEETRVSIGLDNVFDEKIQVEDQSGRTPINFQEDLLNPLGRTFRFELRRRF